MPKKLISPANVTATSNMLPISVFCHRLALPAQDPPAPCSHLLCWPACANFHSVNQSPKNLCSKELSNMTQCDFTVCRKTHGERKSSRSVTVCSAARQHPTKANASLSGHKCKHKEVHVPAQSADVQECSASLMDSALTAENPKKHRICGEDSKTFKHI